MMNSKPSSLLTCVLMFCLAACDNQGGTNTVEPAGVESKYSFADVVIRDTSVYTLNSAQPWAQAVAIHDGQILMVGSNVEAAALIGPETRVFSQPAGLVLPGFQDAHVHPLSSGIEHFDCKLDSMALTQQAYLDKISECNLSFPEREWISGDGWNVLAFPPNGIPDKALLDGVISDRPVVFFSSDGHSAWTNSMAIEIAGITAETPDPPNGRIDRDPTTGEPVGSFQESAMDLIRAHLPPPPQSQIDDGMRYTISYLHSLGITAMQEANASTDPDDPRQALATYRRFADSGELKTRTVVSLGWDTTVRDFSTTAAY